eukprot:2764899-Amphidinium_carterae.1
MACNHCKLKEGLENPCCLSSEAHESVQIKAEYDCLISWLKRQQHRMQKSALRKAVRMLTTLQTTHEAWLLDALARAAATHTHTPICCCQSDCPERHCRQHLDPFSPATSLIVISAGLLPHGG